MRSDFRAVAAAAVVALAALAAGCGTKAPPLGQLDANALLDRGMAEYRAGNWQESIRYLDHLVLEHPNDPHIDQARYYLADAYFQKKEYVSAAGRFTRLSEDFPRSEYADDARFKACDAYRRLSPDPTLDQEYTTAAIDHCQGLTAYYPDSEYVPRAKQIIEQMRTKLAEKILLNAEFYSKRRAYDSALIYLQRVLSDYPQTKAAPEALRRMVETYEKIGYEEEAQQARERLLRDYPDSPQAKGLAARTSSATDTTATRAPSR